MCKLPDLGPDLGPHPTEELIDSVTDDNKGGAFETVFDVSKFDETVNKNKITIFSCNCPECLKVKEALLHVEYEA